MIPVTDAMLKRFNAELKKRNAPLPFNDDVRAALEAALSDGDAPAPEAVVAKALDDLASAYPGDTDGSIRAAISPAPGGQLVEALLQQVGNSIADVIEQMLKGNWRDDHGHDVCNNIKMLALKTSLETIGKFREDHLGYSKFQTKARADWLTEFPRNRLKDAKLLDRAISALDNIEASFNAQIQEMSERFRAVNIARVIEQSGHDFLAQAAEVTRLRQENDDLRRTPAEGRVRW